MSLPLLPLQSTAHSKHVENQFCITRHSLMQLIHNSEKIMVKPPGGELSLAIGTGKDNLRLLKYPNIICLHAWGTEKKL